MDSLILQDAVADGKKRETEMRVANKELLDAYKKIFSSPEGKKVLIDIFDMTSLFRTTFTGNSYSYYLEGHRKIGLNLLDRILSADKEIYIDLIRKIETKDRGVKP